MRVSQFADEPVARAGEGTERCGPPACLVSIPHPLACAEHDPKQAMGLNRFHVCKNLPDAGSEVRPGTRCGQTWFDGSVASSAHSHVGGPQGATPRCTLQSVMQRCFG